MIDKIVQMSVREYESLQRAAKLKEKQIQQEALKLWKEKGVATIKITVACNDNSHLDNECEIDCSSFVWYKNEHFIIQQPLRSRIQNLIKILTQSIIDYYIGETTFKAHWQAGSNYAVWQTCGYLGDDYSGYMLFPTHDKNEYFCLYYTC